MGILDWCKEKVTDVKSNVVKSKTKSAINEKFNLDGRFDSQIDELSDNIIDKVGVDNIIKAKKFYDKVKK